MVKEMNRKTEPYPRVSGVFLGGTGGVRTPFRVHWRAGGASSPVVELAVAGGGRSEAEEKGERASARRRRRTAMGSGCHWIEPELVGDLSGRLHGASGLAVDGEVGAFARRSEGSTMGPSGHGEADRRGRERPEKKRLRGVRVSELELDNGEIQ